MSATSNSDFAKRMMLLARPAEQFRPTAIYDPDGDCIEFLAKPDAFYAERVDELVTVYYSQETGELIGSLIKGVSRLCREVIAKLPGFQIEIHDPPVRLQHLFQARLWSLQPSEDEMVTLAYRKLVEISEEAVVEGELCVS